MKGRRWLVVMGGSTALVLDMLAVDVDASETPSLVARARAGDREARYEFSFDKLHVTEDASGRSIRLDRLNAGVQAPHIVVENGQETTRYIETGIQTDIDLREGQKAVIGKTSIEGGAETVFVVVTGTVIE